ncbi:MAG: histidinol phosphate aminotransferase [Paracoccaceae bacterium]|nr:histidinol phosphate aminotransferase [Paracoccaceae bacterium]
MNSQHPKRVEDYTNANLVLIFVNLLWFFAVLWANWGLGAVIIAGAFFNHLITRLAVNKARREARFQS